MNILLVYATNSGGTQIAGSLVADVLKKHEFTVITKEVSDVSVADIQDKDLVIFGSPSWDFAGNEGMPHENYLSFIEKMKSQKFNDKKFAVFGLGDSSYTYFCGAVDHLEDLVKDMGGRLIIDSLKIDGFYFNQEKNSAMISDWAEKLATVLNQ